MDARVLIKYTYNSMRHFRLISFLISDDRQTDRQRELQYLVDGADEGVNVSVTELCLTDITQCCDTLST